MTTDWLGGGLIVALAAVLWLIYLLPTWFRRNEFLSTERNTVRLQQTLRILAETSEVPDEVHVEANARSVAEQQRVLKKANAQNLLAERAGLQTLIEQGLAAQAATRAQAEREAVLREETFRLRALAEAEGRATENPVSSSAAFPENDPGDYETIVLAPRTSAPTLRQASLRLRRGRAATSGILLLALVVAVLGGVQIAINGAWVVLVVGLVAATLCVTRLGRLARDARVLRQRTVSGRVASAGDARGRAHGAAGRESQLQAARDAGRDLYADDEHIVVVSGDAASGSGRAGAAEQAMPADAQGGTGWTPVALPKPLYVGNRRIDGDMPVAAYAEQTAERAEQALRAAARDSEKALRASQQAEAASDVAAGAGHPEAVGDTGLATAAAVPAAAPAPASSRFASMGVVDTAGTGAFDVDLILAKRRAG